MGLIYEEMKRGFLSKIAYTNSLWGAGLLLLLAAAVATLFFPVGDASKTQSLLLNSISEYTFLGISIAETFKNVFVNHLMQFLFLLGTGLILQFMSSEFRLIRVRSYFPFFLFCMLGGTLLPVVHLDGAAIANLLLMYSFIRLFRSMNHGQEARYAFDASVLLALASLFQSRFLYILPTIWLVMGILQMLSFRSFLASIFGILSVFWIIGGICFLVNDFNFFLVYANDLTNFHFNNLSDISTAEISYIAFMVILMISAIISFWPRQHLDKLRTRNYLNSVLLIWFMLLILWLLSANDESYLLPLISLSAIVIAHYFSLVDTLFSRFLFFALLGLSLTVFISF